MAAEAKAARMYRDEIETLKVQVPYVYSITPATMCSTSLYYSYSVVVSFVALLSPDLPCLLM